MNFALAVSVSGKGLAFLKEILDMSGFSKIDEATNGQVAKQMLTVTPYKLVIINTPLPDEFGENIALEISKKYDISVIMLIKDDIYEKNLEELSETGIFVIQKPVNKQIMLQAIKFVTMASGKISAIRKQNQELNKKIEDIRIIDRAKCCLIQFLNMTEPQAHRFIEKKAMDMRLSKRSVAEDILKTYEM